VGRDCAVHGDYLDNQKKSPLAHTSRKQLKGKQGGKGGGGQGLIERRQTFTWSVLLLEEVTTGGKTKKENWGREKGGKSQTTGNDLRDQLFGGGKNSTEPQRSQSEVSWLREVTRFWGRGKKGKKGAGRRRKTKLLCVGLQTEKGPLTSKTDRGRGAGKS